MSSLNNEWYKNKGIDTYYERKILNYKPLILDPKNEDKEILNRIITTRIERAEVFSLENSKEKYEDLILKAEEILEKIKKIKQKDEYFNYFIFEIKDKSSSVIIQEEEILSHYERDRFSELFSFVYRIKKAMENSLDVLNNLYSHAIGAEKESIDLWMKSEIDFLVLLEREKLLEEKKEIEEMYEEQIYKKLAESEEYKKRLDQYNTSNSDIGFVQKNRTLIFESILKIAEKLSDTSYKFIPGDVKGFREILSEKEKKNDILTYILLAFKSLREKCENLKRQLYIFSKEKENVFFKKQFEYYDLINKQKQSSSAWIYEQEPGRNEAIDFFSEIVADTIEKTSQTFEKTNGQMLHFYKNEKKVYEEILSLIEKKEQLRHYINEIENSKL